MKKAIFILSVVVLSCAANAQNADQIIAKVQQNERIKSSKSTVKQTITTSSGSKRTMVMESYAKNYNESQLSVYTSPARISGDKILLMNDGDDIWFYTPKTDRIRHLASHAKKQKVQGSDFTYEDYENWDYQKDFKTTLLGKEKVNVVNCFKLELIPTESGPHYSKMIIWVDVDKYLVLKAEYYEDGAPLKTLQCSDVKKVDNYWVPMKMTMTNLQDGGSTTIETTDLQINVELDDNLFTTNYLQKN